MRCVTQFGACVGMSLLVVLSGCGGGGGGDGGGSGNVPSSPAPAPGTPPGGSNQDGLSITADKSELRFVTVQGLGYSSDRITFTLAGAQSSANYYAMAESDGKIQIGSHIAASTLTTMTVHLGTSSAPANVDGNVTFKLCRDEKCANVAWSRAIPYRMRDYRIDNTPVDLAALEGQPVSATRLITPAPVAGDLTLHSTESWLSAAIEDGGKLVIRNNPAAAKGSYRGYLSLRPDALQAQSLSLDVKLAVASNAVASVPAGSALTVSPRTTGPGQVLRGSVPLTFQGGPARRWSVSSDQPWLVPSTAGGDGAADTVVDYVVDTSRLVLDNFASTSATLTFEVSGQAPIRHQVVVDKKLPELRAVTPALVASERPAVLRVGGRGFDLLDSLASFTLDGAAVAAGTVVSGSQARVELAAPRAGSHGVGLPVSYGLTRLGFQAVQVTPLAAAEIDTPGAFGEAIHSATRNALYVVDSGTGRLSRLRPASGRWTVERSVTLARDARVGLSPDEQTLYTTAPGMTLEVRDPDTLAVRASHVASGFGTLDGGFRSAGNARLPVTTDGRVWFEQSGTTGLLAFDSVSGKFFAAVSASLSGFMDSTLAISGDGGTMLNIKLGGHTSVQTYDVGSGAFKRIDLPLTVGPVPMSRDGNYLVISQWLYQHRDFGVAGTLPSESGTTLTGALLAPDGSRVYLIKYGLADMRYAPVAISVVDTVSMKFIGDIALPVNVSECGANDDGCVSHGRFSLSTFGDAIIWTGNRKTMIVPIPKAMGAVGATRSIVVR